MLSSSRIQARDRRRAAIHEAGHIVVAIHYGAAADGYIERIGGDWRRQKTWVGRARIRLSSLTAGQQFDCSVAGGLAESLFFDPDDDYWLDDSDTVLDFVSSLSETDKDVTDINWPETDADPGYADLVTRLEKALRLVRNLWPEIWIESRHLIDDQKEAV